MGRPRLPTTVLEMRGSFKKDPKRGRARENEPKPTSILGEPPADFQKPESPTAVALLAIWRELIAQIPEGVLTGCDGWYLEDVCRLKYAVRRGTAKGSDKMLLEKMQSKLGMNPADRSRVDGGKKKRDNAAAGGWAAIAAARSSQLG